MQKVLHSEKQHVQEGHLGAVDGESILEYSHRSDIGAELPTPVLSIMNDLHKMSAKIHTRSYHIQSNSTDGMALEKSFDVVQFPFPLIYTPDPTAHTDTNPNPMFPMKPPLTLYFVLKPTWLGHGVDAPGQRFFGFSSKAAGHVFGSGSKAGAGAGGEFRFYNGYPAFATLGYVYIYTIWIY